METDATAPGQPVRPTRSTAPLAAVRQRGRRPGVDGLMLMAVLALKAQAEADRAAGRGLAHMPA